MHLSVKHPDVPSSVCAFSVSRCVDLEEDYALFRVRCDCVPVHVAAADLPREELQITQLNERLFDLAAFMQPTELCKDLDGFG